MKKGILITVSFFFFLSLWAQESESVLVCSDGIKEGKSNFRGGVRAGFTGSQITGDGFSFQGYNKFGAFSGVFVNLPVSKKGGWFIQAELNFIMKGCKHIPKQDEFGNLFGNQYRLQLMYGQIPLLAKWIFFKGFDLEFGPVFNILIKNYDVEEVNGYIQKGAPPFFRFELSGIVGLNYLFFKHIGVNLRFEGSLLPVRKITAAHWLYLDRGQHNQTFAFSLFYQF